MVTLRSVFTDCQINLKLIAALKKGEKKQKTLGEKKKEKKERRKKNKKAQHFVPITQMPRNKPGANGKGLSQQR